MIDDLFTTIRMTLLQPTRCFEKEEHKWNWDFLFRGSLFFSLYLSFENGLLIQSRINLHKHKHSDSKKNKNINSSFTSSEEEIVDGDELKPLNDNRDHAKVENLVRTVGQARPILLLIPSPIPVPLSLALYFSRFLSVLVLLFSFFLLIYKL